MFLFILLDTETLYQAHEKYDKQTEMNLNNSSAEANYYMLCKDSEIKIKKINLNESSAIRITQKNICNQKEFNNLKQTSIYSKWCKTVHNNISHELEELTGLKEILKSHN